MADLQSSGKADRAVGRADCSGPSKKPEVGGYVLRPSVSIDKRCGCPDGQCAYF